MWVSNRAAALSAYGPISGWVVSSITDMRYLFNGLGTFDEDVSSWNTSSVTDMQHMFYVRTPARVQCPVSSRFFRARCEHRHRRHAPSRLPTPRALHACLGVTRQYATAFNQPLSLDTSSVTNMGNMFWVRSARAAARALPPQP